MLINFGLANICNSYAVPKILHIVYTQQVYIFILSFIESNLYAGFYCNTVSQRCWYKTCVQGYNIVTDYPQLMFHKWDLLMSTPMTPVYLLRMTASNQATNSNFQHNFCFRACLPQHLLFVYVTLWASDQSKISLNFCAVFSVHNDKQ